MQFFEQSFTTFDEAQTAAKHIAFASNHDAELTSAASGWVVRGIWSHEEAMNLEGRHYAHMARWSALIAIPDNLLGALESIVVTALLKGEEEDEHNEVATMTFVLNQIANAKRDHAAWLVNYDIEQLSE